MEERCGEDEGADGDQDRSGDDHDGEDLVCACEWGEEVFDLGQVCEGSDVEAEVHELEEDEERLHDWVRGGREFVAGGEDAAGEIRFGLGLGWSWRGWGFGGGDGVGDSIGDFFANSFDWGYEAVAAAG